MQILPDGNVQIRNKRTGETKVVSPAELGGYGISYTSYLAEKEAFDQIQDPGKVNVELKGQQATNVNLLKNILSSTQAATESYKPEYTGFLNSLLGTGKIAMNAPGAAEEQAFRQRVADIRTAVRSAISGAAISPYEAKEIEELIPKISQSDTKALSQLEGLLGITKGKIGNVLSTAGYNVPIDTYLQQGKPPATNKDPLGIL